MKNFLIRARTFLRSLWWHLYAGFPKCSQSEIMFRHNICMSCDKYDHKNQECSVCGCAISNKKIFMNKLAWADQECPEKKWYKIIR